MEPSVGPQLESATRKRHVTGLALSVQTTSFYQTVRNARQAVVRVPSVLPVNARVETFSVAAVESSIRPEPVPRFRPSVNSFAKTREDFVSSLMASLLMERRVESLGRVSRDSVPALISVRFITYLYAKYLTYLHNVTVAEAVGWYKRNLAIAVPVTVIIGGLILASLYSCIANCYRKKRQPPVPVIPARAPGYPGNASRRSARLSTRQSSNPPRASQQPPPPPNNPQWSLPSVAPTSPIYAHTAPDAVYNPQLARVDSSTMGESYPLQPMHLQTRHSGVHETVRREERDLPPAPADTSHWVDPRAYNGFG